jgi:hypothetical protein
MEDDQCSYGDRDRLERHVPIDTRNEPQSPSTRVRGSEDQAGLASCLAGFGRKMIKEMRRFVYEV